jgi:YhcH/YjgK/YiaL family protein
MIVGRLVHWRERMPGAAWGRAFEALERVRADDPEVITPLGDDGMYLRVMSYPTRRPEADNTVLESHRDMVDIQVTLHGSERIDWFATESLQPKAPYDVEKDRFLYHRPPGPALASVDVLPGMFVVLFPEDAHMPQLITHRGDAEVKKVVVKVPMTLLTRQWE